MSDEVPTAEVNGSGRSRGRTCQPHPDMTLVQAKLSRAMIGLIVLILSLLLIGFSHYSRELQLLGGYLQKKCLQKGLQSKLT